MSRKKSRGKMSRVLREARREVLPISEKKLKQFQSDLPKINEMKTKRKIQLQSVLDEKKSVYDENWIGDSMNNVSKKAIRFWYQNCNGLIKKNDVRGFQFEVATMADAGIIFFPSPKLVQM